MPYIKQFNRAGVHLDGPTNSGELSYAISIEIRAFLKSVPNGGFEGAISKVYGAIEAARLAFEQEVVIPYEAKKRDENGSIYDEKA